MKSQFHLKATPVAYGSQRVKLHMQEALADMHVTVADELSRCSECALTYICLGVCVPVQVYGRSGRYWCDIHL